MAVGCAAQLRRGYWHPIAPPRTNGLGTPEVIATAFAAAVLQYRERDLQYLVFDEGRPRSAGPRETLSMAYRVAVDRGTTCIVKMRVDDDEQAAEIRFIGTDRHEMRAIDDQGKPTDPPQVYERRFAP